MPSRLFHAWGVNHLHIFILHELLWRVIYSSCICFCIMFRLQQDFLFYMQPLIDLSVLPLDNSTLLMDSSQCPLPQLSPTDQSSTTQPFHTSLNSTQPEQSMATTPHSCATHCGWWSLRSCNLTGCWCSASRFIHACSSRPFTAPL